jgi:hypothetical protein
MPTPAAQLAGSLPPAHSNEIGSSFADFRLSRSEPRSYHIPVVIKPFTWKHQTITALASKTPVAKHGKGTKPEHDYVIADLSLKDWGRKEIAIVEHEMPGLMAIRKKYVGTQALKGARIAGSLHMTIQTAVLIETLQALGADIRCGIKGVGSHCFCRNCAVFLDAGFAVAACRSAGNRGSRRR